MQKSQRSGVAKMIDIENIVVDKIIDGLTKEFENITVSSEETKVPASFPAVLILEKSNTVYLDSRDENKENHVNVMFQADIYDNDVADKKSNCRNIATKLDDIMQKMGFTRTFLEPIANLEDATIYRISARYTAVVSKLINDEVHYIYDK